MRDREVVVTKDTRSLGLPAKAVVISVIFAFAAGPSEQRATSPKNANWPLHNLDLAGSRFSTIHQITTSHVKSLTPRWLCQTGFIDGVSNQTTPVVVDGIMYVTDPRVSVYALDAADIHFI